LLDRLAELVSFAVPESMEQTEFDQIWQRLEADRKEGRQDEGDKDKDDETLKDEYRVIAERRVRLGLLLAEIGRINNINVSPDEMMRAMQTEASRYPGQEATVMEFFRKNPRAADNLRGPIFEDKVIDFVLELAQTTERVVSPEELAKDPEAVMPEAV
jgi:trigger factor